MHPIGGDAVGPDDAVLVVVQLDGHGHQPVEADAVAAHVDQLRLAVLIQVGGIDGGAVARAQLEAVADFDGLLGLQPPAADGAAVAGGGFGDVGQLADGEVAAEVGPGEVVRLLIGPDDVVAAVLDRRIRDDHDARRVHVLGGRQTDARRVAGNRADGANLGLGRRAQEAAAQGVDQLGIDDGHIAAHQGKDQSPLARRLREARPPPVEDGLDRLARRHADKGSYIGDGLAIGRLHFGQRVERRRLLPFAHEEGRLDVGGVVAVVAGDEGVLALRVGHGELLRRLATHRADVGVDGHRRHAAAVEDVEVGLDHGRVVLVQRRLAAVEGVGVLHDELAQANQAATRPRFVAELLADVVDHLRQVAVAFDVTQRQIDDDLLVRGRKGVVAVAATFQLEEYVYLAPAAGGLPQRRRVQVGHPHLLPADGVHLLGQDTPNLADDAVAEGHEGVNACAGGANVVGADE